MDKKEEFKEFIKTKPELVNYVKDKKYTWQDFYEVYDIYGKDEDVWKKYKEEVSVRSDSNSLKELTSLVKNIKYPKLKWCISDDRSNEGHVDKLVEQFKKNGINEVHVEKTNNERYEKRKVY